MRRTEIVDIVEELGRLVDEHYVFADIGTQVRQVLTDALAAGRYREGTPAEDLAAQVTEDLQSVNNDRHLRLRHAEDELPITSGQAEADAAELAEAAREAARHAGGVARVELIEGNIGYIDLSPSLYPPAVGGDAVAAAMTLVAGTDGLILDLRRCGGGSPAMNAFVISYLFGPEPFLLFSFEERDPTAVEQHWTVSHLPSPRYGPDRPVAVLTSAFTFSGGEGIAWDLREHGRATVIGERTRGGAHPCRFFRMHPHLRATIPVARHVGRISGGNWEGTGVTPDLEVPAEQALDRAREHLLQ